MAMEQMMSVYSQIGEAIGESLETVCCMREEERDQLIQTLGLTEVIKNIQESIKQTDTNSENNETEEKPSLSLNERIAAAIGETVDNVKKMNRSERRELITALGLEQHRDDDESPGPSNVIDVADISSDDDMLVNNDDDDADHVDGAVVRGWGECPVCCQLMRNEKLQYHAMACQGLHLNGGDGLEVNPMEVQSKCGMCGCLVPDLVMEEHRVTCWANNSSKRRIETPMERRRAKFPKTNYWSSAPRK